MKSKSESGFSLIELLIVVVIIGIVASVAVPALQKGLRAAENGNTFATIDGVTVTGATIAGIRINDNPLNTNGATVYAEVKGNTTVTGSPTGILVFGSDATANVHNNSSSITGNVIGIDVDGGTTTIFQNNIYANGTGVRVINSGNLTSATENFITNNLSLIHI